jgi:hypothetical protein
VQSLLKASLLTLFEPVANLCEDIDGFASLVRGGLLGSEVLHEVAVGFVFD